MINQTLICQECQFQNASAAKICQICGNFLVNQDDIPDHEFAQLSHTGNYKLREIAQEIKWSQDKIKDHRGANSQQQKCWYFGLDSLFDYGDVWSSTSYWHGLIVANKNLCTQDMNFSEFQLCCEECSSELEKLQNLKQQWEQNVKTVYDFLH